MKTSSLFLAAALSCIAMSAAAGGSRGSQGSQGAAGGGGGGGGGSGIGVGIAGARSTAAARATASNRTQVGVATNVGLGVTTGANTAAGGLGLGGNATGIGGAGGSIGAGAVQIGGTTYEAAASPSFAPGAHGPLKSCRLYAGMGGASRDGSGSAGIPIGNDQICLTDAAHELMNRLNARKAGTFSDEDYLRPACKVEGMSETQACKALAQQQSAAAPVGMAYTPN